MSGYQPPEEAHVRPPDAEPPDDVDRVYARLTQLPPPRDFASIVLLTIRGAASYRLGRRQIGWLAAELAGVVALALLAYLAGQALVGGGVLALVAALATDAEALRLFPADTLLSLVEAFPWIELLLLILASAAVASCTRHLVRALAEPPARLAGSGAGAVAGDAELQ